MIRQPYRGLVKPYHNSDDTVPIRWFFAHPCARTLPFPTCFGDPIFSDLKEDVPTGLVWDRYVDWDFAGNTNGYLGLNVCGTPQAFLRGVSINDPPTDCICRREPVRPVQEIPTGVVDGVNKHFAVSQMPLSAQALLVHVNGVTQTQGQDYSVAGQDIYFTTASRPRVGSALLVYYMVGTC
jgi:hypothetical protein